MVCWNSVKGNSLLQGDYLTDCFIPVLNPEPDSSEEAVHTVGVNTADLIIITQSCDLAQKKVNFVALCPIHSIEEFSNVHGYQKAKKEEIRRGKAEGLHLLPAFDDPKNNGNAMVVDFRQIYSLPIAVVEKHAEKMETHWRLKSPHLEHFSQSFARFFMRVGLPEELEIPRYA